VTDRHKNDPKAVRMPGGLLAWYEEHAKAAGISVNAALVGALEEYRARHDSGSTTPPVAAKSGSTTCKSAPKRPAVAKGQPEGASDIAAYFASRRTGGQ
jgi:hypothetical protein